MNWSNCFFCSVLQDPAEADQLLDLSRNQLSENLALSPLSHLTTLEYLFISHNRFDIPITFVSFFNHSKLKSLVGENKDFIDQIEFKQEFLGSNWGFLILLKSGSKNLAGKLPYILSYQYELRAIVLSHYNLVGAFPVWLLENNTRFSQGLSWHRLIPIPMPLKLIFHITVLTAKFQQISAWSFRTWKS